MAIRPTVGSLAEDLYARLGPWADQDTIDAAFELLTICEAIMGRQQPVDDVIRDRGDDPGWSIVMDADNAPPRWLPWLAQFGGVRFPDALSVADQRFRIKNTDGFKRGSPGAVVAAAKSKLTGSKTVALFEFAGSAYRYRISTLESETPDSGAVLAALLEQKPGGQVLTYTTTNGLDFNALRDTHADFNDLTSTYTDFNDMRDHPTK